MELLWDWGTAYDFFVSLEALHRPDKYGLRGSWAAGMRARLPTDARGVLEQAQQFVFVPTHWVHTLPDPKDGAAVLWALEQIPPAERLMTLLFAPCDCKITLLQDVLQRVLDRRAWDESDRVEFQSMAKEMGSPYSQETIINILNWMAHPEESGERYLEAVMAYYEVFFAEEEKRIRPALQAALARAQEIAIQMPIPDLLEELSQGVRFAELPLAKELVLAPSFWSTPLVIMGHAGRQRLVWLFGARPDDASLVPGDIVPETMLRAIKALSDPTRLRILRYLSKEPHSLAELARRLRLRAPTVLHHLTTLRLAGLVQMTLEKDKEKGRYAARSGAITAIFATLQGFLSTESNTDE